MLAAKHAMRTEACSLHNVRELRSLAWGGAADSAGEILDESVGDVVAALRSCLAYDPEGRRARRR